MSEDNNKQTAADDEGGRDTTANVQQLLLDAQLGEPDAAATAEPGIDPEQPAPPPPSGGVYDPEVVRQLANEIGGGLFAGFTFVASVHGDHLALSEQEAGTLGYAWAEPIHRTWPNFRLSPWWAAVAATAMIIGPKLKAHRDIAIARARARGEKNNKQQSKPEPATVEGERGEAV